MIIHNTTDVPNRLVEIAMAFSIADGVHLERIALRNKKEHMIAGQWGWYFHTHMIRLIVPRVWRPMVIKTPYANQRLFINSIHEWLVVIMAHELRHAWQHQIAGWNMRDKMRIEIDAELHEVRQLYAFRAHLGLQESYPQDRVGVEVTLAHLNRRSA